MTWLISVKDAVPNADDVTAGPWGALMFVLLIAATILLVLSFLKQMRKAAAAKRAGVFGDEPEDPQPKP